jgi:hypothetical protein
MHVEQSPRDRPPSGDQFAITYADAQVQIRQVGATLRHFTVGGWNVIDGFAVDERATNGRGQVLAPWPNRLTDGRYRYGDRDCKAPINEVSRHNAIHGLVRWLDWSLLAHDQTSVTLSCAVRPPTRIRVAARPPGHLCLESGWSRRDVPGGQRRHGTSTVRGRVPSVSHAWHGIHRRVGPDCARHDLPRASQSNRRARHGSGHGDAARLHPAPPDRVDTT